MVEPIHPPDAGVLGPDARMRDALARAPRRVEGRDKVTGRVRYAGDFDAAGVGTPDDGLDVAIAITSTRAAGRVAAVDATEALAAPGVRLVMTHENAPRLHKVLSLTGTEIGELLPLQDDVLHYAGQCVAVLVANTWENARDAARLVRVRYADPAHAPATAFTLERGLGRAEDAAKVGGGDKGQVEVGHPDAAYDAAEHKVDLTFDTSPHHHNQMEPGAIAAAWGDDGGLTVHVPTQFSYGDAMMLGQAFGFGLKDRLPRLLGQVLGGLAFDNKVRVVSTMAGGAFGGKQGNVHLLLAPMAARLTGRPVRLVLAREHVFSLMPFRGASRQRLRLAAGADGRLQAIIQDSVAAQGAKGSYVEAIGETVEKAYACPNIRVHTQSARLDTNASGWMRGPGSSLGRFASEVAMDALAHEVGLDPLDFRLLNHADVEPDTGHEWSSKSLKQCYQLAAERIGWFGRDPGVGAMREGRLLVGFGMATSLYPVKQMPAVARVILERDGRARVQTAMHEIGQGAITAMTQIAAEALGLPFADVRFEYGDTALPYGGMTVGSMSTLTNGAAVYDAGQLVKRALCKRAARDPESPLYGAHRHDLDVVGGRVVAPGAPGGAGESVAALMARHPEGKIEEEAITRRDMGRSTYGRQSFGAQFAKVLIDPDTMHVQVERLVGAFAGGRAINPLLVHSQLIGAMVWGLGQALMEETVVDERTGRWMNRSLGEALVPTNADVDGIEAIIVDEDDTRAHPLGIKGMGEIGGVGTAAAIGNAIFHATGARLTALPFRIDRLLGAVAASPRPAARGS